MEQSNIQKKMKTRKKPANLQSDIRRPQTVYFYPQNEICWNYEFKEFIKQYNYNPPAPQP